MRITVEFVGGPLDGQNSVGEWGEPSDAERYFLLTHHGVVGQRFKVASQYAVDTLVRERLQVETRHNFQKHFYEVTDRFENEDEVALRVEYVSDTADKRPRLAS